MNAENIMFKVTIENEDEIKCALDGIKQRIEEVIEASRRMHEALDVAPVVHGRWIQLSSDDEDCNTFICSVCGHEIFHATDVEPLPKHCEECGAKMDGEVQKS